jgi:endonuclease YncB( thermonuclease family)
MKKKIFSLVIVFLFTLSLTFILSSCDTTTTNNPPATTFEDITPVADKVTLTENYAGKDFQTDGIGVATVSRYVDGDTVVFKTANSKEDFTVRFQGIDTPESTYRIDPWGFAASTYTKTQLKQAIDSGATIVLQCEDMTERMDSNGTRWLSWVWIVNQDGTSHLLNLQICELGYAYAKADGTRYSKTFIEAIQRVSSARKRIYGETDPNYDYSKKGKEVTIKQIHELYGTQEKVEAYMKSDSENSAAGTLVVLNGIVVRKNGNKNAYIQQYDADDNQYYGIYVYGGYNNITKLEVGYSVQITAKIGYYYGSLQITDVTNDNAIKVYSFNQIDNTKAVETDPSTLSINDYSCIGKLVEIKNLTVTGHKDSTTGGHAFTIYTSYTDSTGATHRLDIRVDGQIELKDSAGKIITSGAFFDGKVISSIKAIVGYYNGDPKSTSYAAGNIQLLLTEMADIEFAE